MRIRRTGNSWVVHTPAKLNLFLEVLGKRPDGFHELETLMVTVSLFDTLIITPTESTSEISLRCHDAGSASRRRDTTGAAGTTDTVPGGRDNLVVRAAELLRTDAIQAGRPDESDVASALCGVHIDLFKRIPAAAGLAGGSSDAAATLLVLNRVWNLGRSRDELQTIAAQMGSDISFFLGPASAAVCRGRGEVIHPLAIPPRIHFVIARPNTGLSTAMVFRHCQPVSNPQGAGSLAACLARGDLRNAGRRLFNSLQPPAIELNPELRDVRKAFSRLPVDGDMMSGSGTAWFGICRSRRQARNAAARLRAWGMRHVFVAESPP